MVKPSKFIGQSKGVIRSRDHACSLRKTQGKSIFITEISVWRSIVFKMPSDSKFIYTQLDIYIVPYRVCHTKITPTTAIMMSMCWLFHAVNFHHHSALKQKPVTTGKPRIMLCYGMKRLAEGQHQSSDVASSYLRSIASCSTETLCFGLITVHPKTETGYIYRFGFLC